MSIYDVFNSGKDTFNREEWAAKKQAQRKAVYEQIEEMCKKMKTDSTKFRQYLKVQGRFDRYSVNNAVLVTAQMPEAAVLKDRAAWRENRVYVNQDAQKVLILEPGREYIREDGSRAVGYNTKEVYDISQTSAAGKIPGRETWKMKELAAAVTDASPVPFQTVEELDGPAFYNREEGVILVSRGLSEQELFDSIIRETAVAIYDLKHKEGRETCGFGAYCTAFMISSRYGMDTGNFHFDKVPDRYTKMEIPEFKKELSVMRDVMQEIQTEMYRSLGKSRADKTRGQER